MDSNRDAHQQTVYSNNGAGALILGAGLGAGALWLFSKGKAKPKPSSKANVETAKPQNTPKQEVAMPQGYQDVVDSYVEQAKSQPITSLNTNELSPEPIKSKGEIIEKAKKKNNTVAPPSENVAKPTTDNVQAADKSKATNDSTKKNDDASSKEVVLPDKDDKEAREFREYLDTIFPQVPEAEIKAKQKELSNKTTKELGLTDSDVNVLRSVADDLGEDYESIVSSLSRGDKSSQRSAFDTLKYVTDPMERLSLTNKLRTFFNNKGGSEYFDSLLSERQSDAYYKLQEGLSKTKRSEINPAVKTGKL